MTMTYIMVFPGSPWSLMRQIMISLTTTPQQTPDSDQIKSKHTQDFYHQNSPFKFSPTQSMISLMQSTTSRWF